MGITDHNWCLQTAILREVLYCSHDAAHPEMYITPLCCIKISLKVIILLSLCDVKQCSLLEIDWYSGQNFYHITSRKTVILMVGAVRSFYPVTPTLQSPYVAFFSHSKTTPSLYKPFISTHCFICLLKQMIN
jgi:hypothetical protein